MFRNVNAVLEKVKTGCCGFRINFMGSDRPWNVQSGGLRPLTERIPANNVYKIIKEEDEPALNATVILGMRGLARASCKREATSVLLSNSTSRAGAQLVYNCRSFWWGSDVTRAVGVVLASACEQDKCHCLCLVPDTNNRRRLETHDGRPRESKMDVRKE